MNNPTSKLKIAEREFESRLLIGTGKFASNFLMRDALEASGTQIVTVALRRADLSGGHDPFADILDYIDPNRYLVRSEEHTSELQSHLNLVCRLLLEKKKKLQNIHNNIVHTPLCYTEQHNHN